MHENQLAVSVQTVHALVGEQFPAWRGLPITAVRASGTVNAIFRIGERLAARFPLQPDAAAAVRTGLEREASAARELAGRTRFRTG
jgi:aminoglycoside phosphotransferase (APT) family kinase protein